jgi:hypothetical protein
MSGCSTSLNQSLPSETNLGDAYTLVAEIVIHLAPKVASIGMDHGRPSEFFYENLMMDAQLREVTWQRYTVAGPSPSLPAAIRLQCHLFAARESV